MAINFPSKPEIRLEKAPLDEVICQVKFPPILRINQDMPMEFQDGIRARFPNLQVDQGVVVQFLDTSLPDNPGMEPSPKIYRFLSSDGSSHVALAADFYALTTQRYVHWEAFRHDLELASRLAARIYQPPYATRIGLRFVNHFSCKNTGCNSVAEMLNLFRHELTSLLRTTTWSEPVEMRSQVVLNDGTGMLALRSGFGREQAEAFFVLDFDYFEEGHIDLDKLSERIEHYHSRIYAAFRWSLVDDSLSNFGPLPEVIQ